MPGIDGATLLCSPAPAGEHDPVDSHVGEDQGAAVARELGVAAFASKLECLTRITTIVDAVIDAHRDERDVQPV
jgi:hypothetical protein